jgi:hypothetical protein
MRALPSCVAFGAPAALEGGGQQRLTILCLLQTTLNSVCCRASSRTSSGDFEEFIFSVHSLCFLLFNRVHRRASRHLASLPRRLRRFVHRFPAVVEWGARIGGVVQVYGCPPRTLCRCTLIASITYDASDGCILPAGIFGCRLPPIWGGAFPKSSFVRLLARLCTVKSGCVPRRIARPARCQGGQRVFV